MIFFVKCWYPNYEIIGIICLIVVFVSKGGRDLIETNLSN